MKTNQQSRLVCRPASKVDRYLRKKKPDVLAIMCYVQHGTEFKFRHLVANQVNCQELKERFSLIHA